MTLISDRYHHGDKRSGFLEDADISVRLLRMISLRKISSSLGEKTLSEDSSETEKFSSYEEDL